MVPETAINEDYSSVFVGLELETIDPKDIDKEISISFDGYDEFKRG